MIFEVEKKRRKRAGEMGSSYVLKNAVELKLFSNLWYFKNYFFQLPYIYQESIKRVGTILFLCVIKFWVNFLHCLAILPSKFKTVMGP